MQSTYKVFCFDDIPDTIFLTKQNANGQSVIEAMLPQGSIFSNKDDPAIAGSEAMSFLTINGMQFVIIACPGKIIVF